MRGLEGTYATVPEGVIPAGWPEYEDFDGATLPLTGKIQEVFAESRGGQDVISVEINGWCWWMKDVEFTR